MGDCKHEFMTDGGACLHCRKTVYEMQMEEFENKHPDTGKVELRADPDYVGQFPIRTNITVLPADRP